MNKYTVEGGIDFFSELKKLKDDPNDAENMNNDNSNVCLITQEKLEEYFVTMSCGHKFNYEPLFKYLFNHKKKFNKMEIHHVKVYEIICPYCRNKQVGLLPYYEELNLPKVYGVNYIDYPFDDVILCEYSDTIKCPQIGAKIMGNNYGYDKHYCDFHKKIVISAAKAEIKKAKQLEKEQIKQSKLELKQKLKEQKQTNKTKELNCIKEQCSHILKTGINKGAQCKCNALNNGLCKKHSNPII
jgi:hypothetical protein